MKKNLIFATLFFILLPSFIAKPSCGAETDAYTTEYHAEYFPKQGESTDVNLTIQITNIRSDIVIKQFNLSFPKAFPIENIKVLSDTKITPHIDFAQKHEVVLDLPKELQKKDQKITIQLNYSQKNIFKKNGNVYEFIAPTVSSKKSTRFSATLHVPGFVKEKTSLVKPPPTSIQGNDIVWNSVSADTLYVLFGKSQSYQLQLQYNLKNDSFSRKEISIALPPETLYQKIFVQSLDPHPISVSLDEDGNYLAHYVLNPHATQTVHFTAVAEVFVKPQEDMKPFIQDSIKTQRNYLTLKTPYWNLGTLQNDPVIKSLGSLEEIYNGLISTLSYRFNKIADRKRLGAQRTLLERANAVCTEYSDLLVALFRNKKILTREIEGYGFSSDAALRPLSLVSDVLHSWVEYYDIKNGIWIPLDPTWQDTSKIDYFSSFDTNHIAFAIHGKNDTYPLPAGMYKIANTKDVIVSPIEEIPQQEPKLDIKTSLKSVLIINQPSLFTVTVENQGSTFIKNKTFSVKSDSITFKPAKFNVLLLPPLQKKQLTFTAIPKGEKKADQVSFYSDSEPLLKKPVRLQSDEGQFLMTALGVIVGIATVTFLLVAKSMKKI